MCERNVGTWTVDSKTTNTIRSSYISLFRRRSQGVNEMNRGCCWEEMLTQVHSAPPPHTPYCTRYIRIILAKKQRTLTVYLLYGRCPRWRIKTLCTYRASREHSRKYAMIVACLRQYKLVQKIGASKATGCRTAAQPPHSKLYI